MSLIDTAPQGLSTQRICQALGQPRHRCYPDRRHRPACAPRKPHPRQLTPDERQRALATLHSPRFCDASPRHVHAQLLSEGQVLASPSTLYRLLRSQDQAQPRRWQRPPQRHVKPQLVATGPNQVWTWDITKLPTHARGVYLNLYLILDLYSRYVVGWMISRKENAGLAKHLFTRVLAAHLIDPGQLTVHSDRGAPMIAHSFADLLSDLGVERSHSRPRVSNDNAFSESQFKTLKYAPGYPGRFADGADARAWTRGFVEHYSHHRPHEGIALFTPADVFFGRVDEIAAVRQQALDQHYAAFPQRYINGPPVVALPPSSVHINPDQAIPADQLIGHVRGFAAGTSPVETGLPEVVT
jgi:putative transposase